MPLLAAAFCFGLGIVIARSWTHPPLLALSVAALLILIFTAASLAPRVMLVPVAAMWIVAGIVSWQWRPLPPLQRELAPYADGLSRDVRGHVVRVRALTQQASSNNADTDPTWWQEREPDTRNAVSVDLAIDAIEDVTPDTSRMVPVHGGVRITLLTQDQPPPLLRCGDVITLPLRLRPFQRYNDPGAWQYADYLLAQGLAMHSTGRAAKLHIAGHDSSGLRCRLSEAQSWSSKRLSDYSASSYNRNLPRLLQLSSDDTAMLSAMLFGDRAQLTQPLRIGFERTGSFHLFVVSGMHVALLAAMLLSLLRCFRVREWASALIVIPLLAGYALLTGFGAPVQRALFMTIIFIVARLLSRERSVLNALGAAALAELIWSPGSLVEASFQMTFLSVFAIVGIAVPLAERSILPVARASRNLDELWRDTHLSPGLAQLRVMLRLWGELLADSYGKWLYRVPALLVSSTLWLIELALIGLVAELVMTLPMALYFHRATIFALPANMLTIPVIGLLAPLAIAFFALLLISPAIATLPAALVACLLHAIMWSITRVSSIQNADLRVPGPSILFAVMAFLVWTACAWAVRQSRRWVFTALVLLPTGTCIALWPQHSLTLANTLEVTAIDVGQGDSLFISSPDGHTMLIDAGGPVGRNETSAQLSGFDIGEEVVSPYLWSRRIRRLDILVLTHAHSDHMGGMESVMRNLRPRELWVSRDADLNAYRDLLHEASSLGITVRHLQAGNVMQWGGTMLKVLSPDASYVSSGTPRNSDSLVMRMDYGLASVILEGDAEADSERSMLQQDLSPVTLLKVGHHGSRTSTTEPFLKVLQPKAAVISVGRGNTFGHPRMEIIDRLAASGARVYRTDEFGLISFFLKEDGSISERSASSEQ